MSTIDFETEKTKTDNLDVLLSTRLKPGDLNLDVDKDLQVDVKTMPTVTVTNLAQQGGVAISLNTGVRDTGTQRVTVATDDLVPISAASLPLPTGASTEATLSTLNTKINTEITSDYDTGAGVQTMKMSGIALPASGGAIAGGTAAAPIRIDPTGTTTQPISAASLPLPTGATTETTLAKITSTYNQISIASDNITTINYTDATKTAVATIVQSSVSVGLTATETFNNSGATTLVITRVVV